jgi:hypothetical protein
MIVECAVAIWLYPLILNGQGRWLEAAKDS